MRGQEFVTRKITNSLAKISLGKLDYLELGNLDAKRDWGYAKDYVEGMWKILQAEESDTFVLATNRTETIRFFLEEAAKHVGYDIKFEGSGLDEIAYDNSSGKVIAKINKDFYRPAEVDILIGDYSKANKVLSWEPKTSLEDLAKIMIDADLRRNKENKSF